MAERLWKKKIEIDAFVSSTAKRAFTTAEYFAKAYDVKTKSIIKVDELYHAAPSVFYHVITKLDDALKTVAIFSHNPGITSFVNELTDTRIDNMPTCGIFAVKVKTKSWKEFPFATKEFWFFDYPKLHV